MKKAFGFLLIVVVIVVAVFGYAKYKSVFEDNIKGSEDIYFYISTGSDYSTVLEKLADQDILESVESFDWVANKMNYPNHIYPGRYLIDKSMSNRKLIEKLRSGIQEPVKFTFNNIRIKSQLAGKVGKQLEIDSVEFLEKLNDQVFAQQYGLDKESILTLFIPNTYELYWNTSIDEFMDRMVRENDLFWSDKRIEKAKNLGLTKTEIINLAAIVEKEISIQTEAPRVAGVYLNRLKRNMLLQADPTIVYASGNFNLKRVLNIHKKIDSPYNTYMYVGLPPGPICLPSIKTIDGVLNAETHNYLYFCADASFNGKHHFSTTYNEHLNYARKYQSSLNKKKIFQ